MKEGSVGALRELRELGLSYDLMFVDYDIRDVLEHVPAENLEGMVGNVTGVAIRMDSSGAEFAEVWATDSTFAPSLDAIYERVR
jgi:hypothetical protein